MYEVQMKYLDRYDDISPVMFTCENYNIDDNGYKFENIQMENFVLSDLEVNKEDVALMKIK